MASNFGLLPVQICKKNVNFFLMFTIYVFMWTKTTVTLTACVWKDKSLKFVPKRILSLSYLKYFFF